MRRDEPPRFRDEGGKVHKSGRILPIPVDGGERPFTEPTTGARSWRRGLVFMPPFWPFVDATRFYRGWWRHLVKIARGVTYLFVGRCHEAEPNPLPCVVPAISGPCCECSHYFVLPVCGSVNRYRALGDEGLSGRGCLRPSRGAPGGTLPKRGSDNFRKATRKFW